MRIASRRKATITFLVLGVGLAGVAVAVGFGWIILNWREAVSYTHLDVYKRQELC